MESIYLCIHGGHELQSKVNATDMLKSEASKKARARKFGSRPPISLRRQYLPRRSIIITILIVPGAHTYLYKEASPVISDSNVVGHCR